MFSEGVGSGQSRLPIGVSYVSSLSAYSTASSSVIACPSAQARANLAVSAESIVMPIANTIALSVTVRPIVAVLLPIATSAYTRSRA